MKLIFGKLNIFVMLIALVFVTSFISKAEAQTPYTNTGKAKYVKTTVDTFSIPGVTGAYRQGFITNQSASLSLNVMFSKRDGSKDTSSRVVIPAGKTLHFNFVGTKIFRYAVTGTDSVYSQVIVGDVQLNFNGYESEELNNIEFANQNESLLAYFMKKENYNASQAILADNRINRARVKKEV